MQRHSFVALGSTFVVGAEYEFVRGLGQGAYGFVVSARHKRSGESCAIKKVTDINTKFKLTMQCLREIKLLHHFRGHKNITCLYDLDIVFQPDGSFDEVYLYEELMEADLHAIIRSGQPLTDAHFQSLIYQTLCGLKYIHSANVLHRDIKPGNLLVNADCELKICDFGLARGYRPGVGAPNSGATFMSEYVAMRWYRAPEVMFSYANYTTAVDIWSTGCVLAELLGGKPIFKGRDYVDQLNHIIYYLGTPSEDTLRRIAKPSAQEYIRSLPTKAPIPFSTLYPDASPLAIDLLSQMLCFDPAKRISCEQALNHPYLQVWHDESDEVNCEAKFESWFEGEDSILGAKKLIVEEVNSFRKEVRAQAKEAGRVHGYDGAPLSDQQDVTGPTSDYTMPQHRPLMPVMDNQIAQPVATDSDLLYQSSTSATYSNVPLQVAVTANVSSPMLASPIQTSSLAPGAVEVAASRVLDIVAEMSGRSSTNSPLNYPDTNTLPNDLTNHITQDGRDPIASGGFADIYRGVLQENGESVKVAIKAIKTYSGEDGDFVKKQKRLRREIKVWLGLRHANVLPLLGTTTGFGRFPAMVCPWTERGTLTSYLEDRYDSLSVVGILGLLNNVASGLQYLHSCSIVHGDLSGSNVLICESGKAYIADFGLSMLLTELGASTFATSFHARGTLRWTAPELLDLEIPEDDMEEESPSAAPTTRSDVYSFGSVMLQILSGKVPYHYYTRDAQVMHAVSRGMTPRQPSSTLVTERRWMFIQRCWSAMDARPLSEEIVEFTGEELADASA